jgi:hypothetical protein
MALTFASENREVGFGHQRQVTVSVTFDNSYPTGGEAVTAGDFGLSVIEDVIVHGPAANAAGTAGLPVHYNRSTGKLQLFRVDAANVGIVNLQEAANAFDASLFTVRLTVLGY